MSQAELDSGSARATTVRHSDEWSGPAAQLRAFPAIKIPAWALVAAELTLLALLLAVAGAMRLGDFEGARSTFPDLFDEGIRAEQLFLMSHGFRPFRDIYAAQGPLLLDLMYPGYALLGGTLGAARMVVSLFSILGILAAYWAAREIAGPIAGLVAAGLLVASSIYLEGSRLALAEVPSLAPALLGLAAAIRFHRRGGYIWLALAAVGLAIGVLVKPMVIGAAVPVALAIGLRPGIRPGELFAFVAIGLAVVTLAVVSMGPADVYEQLVVYRLGSRQSEGWELDKNVKEVVLWPARARPALVGLGVVGAIGASITLGRTGLAALAWVLATYAVLLIYTPLHPKHQVYLIPPLALAAGAGLAGLTRWVARSNGQIAFRTVGVAALLGLLVWELALAPAALARGTQLVDEDIDPDLHVFDAEAATTLAAVALPSEFVLTDHPYLAYVARRLVPPEMVDPSKARFRAGVLTSELAIASGERRQVAAVLFWADRFRRLNAFSDWVEQRYVPVHVLGTRVLKGRDGKDRSIYVRREADFDRIRTSIQSGLPTRLVACFGDDVRLVGARLSSTEIAPGSRLAVTLEWEALTQRVPEFNLVVSLLGPDGQLWGAQQIELDGSPSGTAAWAQDRWLLRSAMLNVEPGAPPGQYRVIAGLESARRGIAPIRLEGPVPSPEIEVLAGERLVVGTLWVQGSR